MPMRWWIPIFSGPSNEPRFTRAFYVSSYVSVKATRVWTSQVKHTLRFLLMLTIFLYKRANVPVFSSLMCHKYAAVASHSIALLDPRTLYYCTLLLHPYPSAMNKTMVCCLGLIDYPKCNSTGVACSNRSDTSMCAQLIWSFACDSLLCWLILLLLAQGGATVIASFLRGCKKGAHTEADGQLVDRVVITIAPVFLQGYNVLASTACAHDASATQALGAKGVGWLISCFYITNWLLQARVSSRGIKTLSRESNFITNIESVINALGASVGPSRPLKW